MAPPHHGRHAPALLVVSHALAALGMSLPWPLLVAEVWSHTHDDLLLGISGAARMLPYVLLSWWVAQVGDRFRRSAVIRATLVGRAVLLVAASLVAGADRIGAAVVLATATVAVGTAAYPAAAAGMPALAGRDNDRWTGALVTCEVASFVVGPALGGLLVGRASLAIGSLVAAGLTVAALVAISGVTMPAPSANAGVPRPEAPSPRRFAVRDVVSAGRGFLIAIGVLVALNAALAGLSIVLLPLAEQAWSDPGAFGLATAVLGFGGLLGPLVARIGLVSGLAGGLVAFAAVTAAVALSPGLAWAAVPLAAAGAVAVRAEALATEAIQAAVPDGRRATALGLADTAMVGAALVATVAAPQIASATGARAHSLVVATGIAVAAALLTLARRGGGSLGWRHGTVDQWPVPCRGVVGVGGPDGRPRR